MRRFLDRLYAASGALAAICLASIAVVMLAQALMRELGMLFRGADDMVAWLTAASAFLALGHTFRRGELVRIGLLIDRLPPRVQRPLALCALAVSVLFVGYMAYAVLRFVFESWQFNELAQGLIQIPIWIPQMSFVLGALILFVAVVDEFLVLARGGKPAYEAAEQERRARKDFSETL
ncbi:MAG TPA: TRAP transporter small permease [Burkholderiales bacterium]|jgi:TRAP-type C4-dicarboxylate transport system permease small subunit|nr:TRAP transporter small permease [Burkholderiales bacterium]